MKIKNISSELIIVAGVKLYPNDIKNLDSDFGEDVEWDNYMDYIIEKMNEPVLIIQNCKT